MDPCSTLTLGRFHRVSISLRQRDSLSRHTMVQSPRSTLTLILKVASSLEVPTKWSRCGMLWMIKTLANEMSVLLHLGILALYVLFLISVEKLGLI